MLQNANLGSHFFPPDFRPVFADPGHLMCTARCLFGWSSPSPSISSTYKPVEIVTPSRYDPCSYKKVVSSDQSSSKRWHDSTRPYCWDRLLRASVPVVSPRRRKDEGNVLSAGTPRT